MKTEAYENYLRSWFYKVCDKLAPNGTLYMCGDWKCSSSMQRVIEERLTVINRITWQREKGRGAKTNWKNAMEDIWFAVKNPKDYYFDVESVKMKRKVIAPYKVDGKPKDWEETDSGNFRITYPSNFWDDISIPFWSMPENTDHPTQKPEKLYAKLVLASTKPGDKIFDPFLGSGTAAVVARKLNRNYFGVEINREYCLWSVKRLMKTLGDKSIQGYFDSVFWERNSLSDQKANKSTKSTKKKNLNYHSTKIMNKNVHDFVELIERNKSINTKEEMISIVTQTIAMVRDGRAVFHTNFFAVVFVIARTFHLVMWSCLYQNLRSMTIYHVLWFW